MLPGARAQGSLRSLGPARCSGRSTRGTRQGRAEPPRRSSCGLRVVREKRGVSARVILAEPRALLRERRSPIMRAVMLRWCWGGLLATLLLASSAGAALDPAERAVVRAIDHRADGA